MIIYFKKVYDFVLENTRTLNSIALLQDGKLKPFIKSEDVPETNDEPVKVVVAKSLRDMVLDSKKNGKYH